MKENTKFTISWGNWVQAIPRDACRCVFARSLADLVKISEHPIRVNPFDTGVAISSVDTNEFLGIIYPLEKAVALARNFDNLDHKERDGIDTRSDRAKMYHNYKDIEWELVK